ncbi:hypothetical protein HYN48_07250 [Flavobacterium magnum]|uniref:Uncharacterized protein n=1 Tax=Flavobacterium magnum TaxID=2162713 RepID=A0A2S0REE6_9FLAO|nr:CHAT domain-containing protein [Flavobacterium magnum]AWA29889.1 hypothetical protein HYN48_07250 [Flavobacterium magnum]
MAEIIYSFPATREQQDKADGQKRPEATYRIEIHSRGGEPTEIHSINTADKDKYYQFVYDDNTSWMADGDTLQELFGEVPQTRGGKIETSLPLELASGAQRGVVGSIVLKLIHVFAKPAGDKLVGDIATRLENKQLSATREGLHIVKRDFTLQYYATDKKAIADDKPILLFVHGTNSNTEGAFGGLAQNRVFDEMYNLYSGNVLAYQHRTLTASPLQNTVDLVKALPDKCTLHLITHSRGGLIGDLLSKYAAGKFFGEQELALFKKEGRKQDLKSIAELESLFRDKRISVEKFVRVASPSAGTLLASDRMDHILNVFFNIAGTTSVFADVLHDLISAVLKEKSNINVLPGLEAMHPQSIFIKALNARSPGSEIDGSSLIVISGNGRLSLSFRGLLVILGKLFYRQRSDLVVNTDSMYLGVCRSGSIQYFFDEGTNVDHIHYFNNQRTLQALLNALKTAPGNTVNGYKRVPQLEIPASDRGVLGIDGGELHPATTPPSGKRPVVLLLPGIMGSNIYDEKSRMWLNYWGILKGDLSHMTDLDGKDIRARSIIKSSYNKLYLQLSKQYDVVIFPFDWRKPMKDAAAELNKKITELLKLSVQIKIIGHSMGGVLVRDFIVYHRETWEILNRRSGFRLLFLGSPLNGSHRIPAVLFGMDGIINKLSFLDMKHSKKELVSFFTSLPGILSLLPFSKGEGMDYADIELWKKMRSGMNDDAWPLPPVGAGTKERLKEFAAYRDEVLSASSGIDYTNMVYIAGQDKATPCGFSITGGRLVFNYTREGDQSVTWATGIPAKMIELEQVYYVDVTHGDLANDDKIFSGIEEILSRGSTNRLSKKRPVFRDTQKTFTINEHTDFDLSETGLERSIMGTTAVTEAVVSRNPLIVSVSHGDLAYASFPVLAGHFNGDAILQAEKAIDHNLNSMLQYKHRMGGYPGPIGTYEVIYKRDPFFEGAIIVGLGEPEKLTAYMLSKSVAIGAANYLIGMPSGNTGYKTVGISALLIGTGYGNLSIENSIKAVIEGVNNANSTVAALDCGYPQITNIEFIEQCETNTISALFALKNIECCDNETYNIKMETARIRKLFGCRKTLPVQNSEEWWNRLAIRTEPIYRNGKNPATDEGGTYQGKKLIFSASTGDARDEVSELHSNTAITDSFLKEISVGGQWSDAVAKSLFELLIPNAFKNQLKRKGHITWILDKDSASYPWELLQDSSVKARPLCIDAGMIRQLSTRDFTPKIEGIISEKALIIADPELGGFLPQLEQAREEGEVVKRQMDMKGWANLSLIGSDYSDIVKVLYTDSYKIVHIAGHGIYDPENTFSSGIVLGNNIFLTPADIQQLPVVPELVFVNCCHLGAVSSVDDKFVRDRYRLAANIGTELIEMGVRAVVVAGWQVADDAAREFAEIFYENLFAGETFGVAVRKARSRIYDPKKPNDNTWGAYQCYGDPYYKLSNRTADPIKNKNYIIEEQVYIDLFNLLNQLDVRYTKKQKVLDKLARITADRKRAGLSSARIDETEAMIYYELAMYDAADMKFRELKGWDDAAFSVNALHKFFSNCTYKAFKEYLDDNANRASAEKQIRDVLKHLQNLQDINATAERHALMGSAYKRLAYMEGTLSKKRSLIEHAIISYRDAYQKSKRIYPLNTLLIYDVILHFGKEKRTKKPDSRELEDYIAILKDTAAQPLQSALDMDYWDNTDPTGMMLALLFLDAENAAQDGPWDRLFEMGSELRRRFGSVGKKQAELYNFELMINALDMYDSSVTNSHLERLRIKVSELLERFKMQHD